MDIVATFFDRFSAAGKRDHDFTLIEYSDKLLFGQDSNQNVVIVCISNRPQRMQIRQKTKLLSVELNMRIRYSIDDRETVNTVHIIRCFAKQRKEQEIFLELIPLFDEASRQRDQDGAILELFSTLSSFFANQREPSDNELQGLFAELYSIWSYSDRCNLAHYWQSHDRMKFDFSITDTVKIEVKSTQKNERKHHFRHEQLLSDIYEIFIISYMLRQDDEGLSLFDLIARCKPLFAQEPKKLMTMYSVIKNASEHRLKEFRFNENYTIANRKIYRASDVPRFDERTPSGVSNAEYDCNLSSATCFDEKDFWNEVLPSVTA